MDYLPKTLIFALNDAHASNIVKIAKEIFGRNDDKFVQKITYSAGDSNELIRQFRNNKEFRIAVTVTLVATGTDVKPLEVIMFMRDVESDSLYTQMKGRGVRTIGDEQLRNVTPNAYSKDLFYLVDAVGVTEHEMKVTRPGTHSKNCWSVSRTAMCRMNICAFWLHACPVFIINAKHPNATNLQGWRKLI